MDSAQLQAALEELQSRVAHQDDTVLKLNDVVAQQQRELMQLKRSLGGLAEQLRSLREANPAAGSGEHELPPHY